MVLTREIEKTFQNADADNSQKLLQAQRQFDDVEQRLAKAKVRFGNTVLRAPNAGTVQALSIINPGQSSRPANTSCASCPTGSGWR